MVEDEPAIADFLHRGLQGERYVVATSLDGIDGGHRAHSGDVDLVHGLPGMLRPGLRDVLNKSSILSPLSHRHDLACVP